MSNLTMWKRLLWKELRTGWLIGLFLLVLPIVLLVAEQFGDNVFEIFAPVITVAIAMTFIGIRDGSAKSVQNHFDTHLPIHPAVQWAIEYVIPLVVAGFIGLWSGFLISLYAYNIDFLNYAIAWMVFFAALFAASHFISSVSYTWLALSMVSLWLGSFIVALPTDNGFADDTVGMKTMTQYNAIILAGAFVGTFLHHVMLRRMLYKRRRLISVGVSVLVIALLVMMNVAVTGNSISGNEASSDTDDIWVSPDHSYIVDLKRKPGGVELKITNQYEGKIINKTLKDQSWLLGATDRRMVYLAQQEMGRNEVKIVTWDSTRDTLQQLATVPAGKNAFTSARRPLKIIPPPYLERGFISPYARYALLILKSQAGGGFDLWLVDLKSKQSDILIANRFFPSYDVIWTDRKAVIYEIIDLYRGEEIVEVDLQAGRAVIRKIRKEAK